MTAIQKMLTQRELRKLAKSNLVDTVCMVFTDMYSRLMGKRLDIDYFFDTALDNDINMCDCIFSLDIDMHTIDGYEYAN